MKRYEWIAVPLAAVLALTITVGSALGVQPGQGRGAVASPEVGADGRVTLRLRAPDAGVVSVNGFGGLQMTKDEQGVWSATTGPLEAGVHEYSFTVDGLRINDPSNNKFKTSFNAVGGSLAFVPGGLTMPAEGVARGAIARHFYQSDISEDDRDFWVYTPPGYDADRSEPYPVLYLLHGLGDESNTWIEMGAANVILDNLIAQGRATPMVMVNTLGYGHPNGPQGAMREGMLANFARQVTEEVLPLVEDRYHVSSDRGRRAIAGLSMGGAEAAFTALNDLDTFAWIGSFSGAFVMWPREGDAEGGSVGGRGGRGGQLTAASIANVFPDLDSSDNDRIELLWMICGTADRLVGVNRAFHEWLDARNVDHTYIEVPDVGHVWPLWRQNLADFAQLLFHAGE